MKSIAAINLLHNPLPDHEFLNTTLLTALADGLEEFGIATRAPLESLMTKEHAVDHRVVNLVHRLYSTGSFSRPVVDHRPEFYKATARSTTFPLVCDKPQPLAFALTVKTPEAGTDQTISLRLNRAPLVDIPATERWTTATFTAPANMLHPGLNEVEICWPMATWSHDQRREHVADSFEAGESVEITPIFGLIHTLRVSLERR